MERGRCYCYQTCCGYANYGKLNQPLQVLFLVPFSFHAALPSFVLGSPVTTSLGIAPISKNLCVFADQAGSCNRESEFSVAVSVFWVAEHNFIFLQPITDETTVSNWKGNKIGLKFLFLSRLEHCSGFHFSIFSLGDSFLAISCSSFLYLFILHVKILSSPFSKMSTHFEWYKLRLWVSHRNDFTYNKDSKCGSWKCQFFICWPVSKTLHK